MEFFGGDAILWGGVYAEVDHWGLVLGTISCSGPFFVPLPGSHEVKSAAPHTLPPWSLASSEPRNNVANRLRTETSKQWTKLSPSGVPQAICSNCLSQRRKSEWQQQVIFSLQWINFNNSLLAFSRLQYVWREMCFFLVTPGLENQVCRLRISS